MDEKKQLATKEHKSKFVKELSLFPSNNKPLVIKRGLVIARLQDKKTNTQLCLNK